MRVTSAKKLSQILKRSNITPAEISKETATLDKYQRPVARATIQSMLVPRTRHYGSKVQAVREALLAINKRRAEYVDAEVDIEGCFL